MKTLLLVGDDKIGRRLIARLQGYEDLQIVLDHSTNLKKVWRLLKKRSISPRLLLKMIWAEYRRPDFQVPGCQAIANNGKLLEIINQQQIGRVYLFRAGLIISPLVIRTGISVLNIHCARIPEYGGLGVVARALKDGAYDQEATMHQVTSRIDEGPVMAVEPYRLDPACSYRENEDRAYDAGIRLLQRELS
ncbi:MAG: hypothetical protein CMJ81_06865 [Planctomycetaceae bacterium]|nr:hypothetical protein [Planctomycetaceae bacterium]MBP60384.1 hypothetical protein [Planctomycetaceae bacterium]